MHTMRKSSVLIIVLLLIAGALILNKKEPSEWQKRFIHDKSDIPIEAFRAFYFDHTQPDSPALKTEIVESIDMNYVLDTGPGFTLPGERFGGYWIGSFYLPLPENHEFIVDQSYANTTIIVDGKRVYWPGHIDTSVVVHLSQGRHIVEVIMENNYFAVGYAVTIRTPERSRNAFYMTISEAKKYLQNVGDEYVLWNAGVYGSSAANNEVSVSLRPSPKKVVLILSSYNTVRWIIHNPSHTEVFAIILVQEEQGSGAISSDVTGFLPMPPVIGVLVPGAGSIYEGDCYTKSNSELSYCDDMRGFLQFSDVITQMMGGHAIDALTNMSEAMAFIVPTTTVDPSDLLKVREDIRQAKNYGHEGF
jgi:hypothetical protein